MTDFSNDLSTSRRQWLQASGALALGGLLPGFAGPSNARRRQRGPASRCASSCPSRPAAARDRGALHRATSSRTLGQASSSSNKPGAAGNIAMGEVARSTDHHTLILGHIGTLAVNPYIFAEAALRPEQGLQARGLLAKVPSLYVVHPDVPAKNLKEFIAYAKCKPGKLSYGSAGNGSAGHLAFEYLKMTAEVFMLHVPYRGSRPAW